MPEHQTSTEHYGPLDQRAIGAGDIGAARDRVVGLLRSVKVDEGYRASVTTAIAAILGAVDALIELGQDHAVLSTLQMQVSRLTQHIEASGASEPVRTLQ